MFYKIPFSPAGGAGSHLITQTRYVTRKRCALVNSTIRFRTAPSFSKATVPALSFIVGSVVPVLLSKCADFLSVAISFPWLDDNDRWGEPPLTAGSGASETPVAVAVIIWFSSILIF